MTAKRVFDLCLAVPGALLLLPVFAVIGVAVRLDSPGPALFLQTRVGRFGKPFKILKFRTMTVDAECSGPRITAGQDPRITRLGAWLRRYKLDELPQLFNVINGSMSLVGPRPEVAEYIAHYPEAARRRILSVRPGITDPAAIEFRDEEAILQASANAEQAYVTQILPRKLSLYEAYIDNWSLAGDLALILGTFRAVLLTPRR